MQKAEATPEMPSFNSLAEIMIHFKKVPLEQFRNDLDNWFKSACDDKADRDLIFREMGGAEFPAQLKPIVESIFLAAEKLSLK